MTTTLEHRILVDTEWGTAVVHADESWTPGAIDPPGHAPARVLKTGIALEDAQGEAAKLGANLQAYFAGEKARLATPAQLKRWLKNVGVDGFRLDTSLALADVPSGKVVTYGELAEKAGRPRAARAAGSTCARNPMPILVPCHRVVPSGGGLGNFGFQGPAYKRRLLDLEGWNGVS